MTVEDVTDSLLSDTETPVLSEPEQLSPEIQVLAGSARQVTLSNGIEVEIGDLKARQFFKLLRIITHGAGNFIASIKYEDDPEQFVGQILGILIFAVPEAPEETIDFVRSMVNMPEIPGPFSKGVPTSAEGLEAARRVSAISELLIDPEIDDMLLIIQNVVEHEREDLVGLGERMAGLMSVAKKTGQVPA